MCNKFKNLMAVFDNPIHKQKSFKCAWKHFETQSSFYSNS